MSKETYHVEQTCPGCGEHAAKEIDGNEMKKAADKGSAELECPSCGKSFEAPLDTSCAEWDDYCKEIHPVPQA